MAESRASFFSRLEPFLAPSTILDIELAYTLAKYGHRYQLRKELDSDGHPIRYFEHVRRAALVLLDEVKLFEPEMIIAALLHDIIEDAKNLPPSLLERCFGPSVVCIIKTLSKVPEAGYLDRFNCCTDWRPYVVKGCDRLDNLRSLKGTSIEFRKRQIAETQEKYFLLFDRMVSLTPSVYLGKVQLLRDAIRKETDHQAILVELEEKRTCQ